MPKSSVAQAQTPSWDNFSHADVWIFDLDNTLYPAHYDVFTQVDQRISAFVAQTLGLDETEVRALRQDYITSHGSTFRAMIEVHDVDVEAFLDYVHDISMDHLPPSDILNQALGKLPGRKLIFTSATQSHADRVMARLGVGHHFEAIFDIKAANYLPKPFQGTYQRLIERHRIEPTGAVMVEDIARNLIPAAALGMTTVWVPNDTPYSRAHSEGDHIHHVVDDLATWLTELTRQTHAQGG